MESNRQPGKPSTSQQIFLVSSTEDQIRLLRRKVEALKAEFYPLQFISARPQSVVTSVDRQTAALVVTVDVWGKDEIRMVEQLRRAGYRGTVVALVGRRMMSPATPVKGQMSLEPLIFLERTGSSRELQGVLRKVLGARHLQQQAFRRYPTEQEAEIAFISESGQTDRHVSRLTNLSKGGAFIECLSQVPLRVGEQCHLRLELKDLKRTYTMPAKVVWTKLPEGDSLVSGFGVEFTGPASIEVVDRL